MRLFLLPPPPVLYHRGRKGLFFGKNRSPEAETTAETAETLSKNLSLDLIIV